jgi:ribonucleoside-triphosphate reductase
LPVHEVTALIEAKDRDKESESMLSTAGKTIFREYTLLNVFPRDIADAHASGALHVNGLSNWILKPNEVMHDLSYFLQNGLKMENLGAFKLSSEPPESFEAALAMAFSVLLLARQEVNENQTIDYFNVFLAPYTKGMEPARIKQNLRQFLLNVNQHVNAAFGLELKTPKFIADKPAVGPKGKTAGTYRDFTEESQLLATLIIEVHAEQSSPKPALNPKIIIKINGETLAEEKASATLLKAHSIAADKGTIYFANMLQYEKKNAAFSASGVKLEADLSEDWETDTMRTGCLGYVTINLPRIVYESEKDKTQVLNLLKERCELAARALGIKHRALKQYGKTSLPFLMQNTSGDAYFRLENCSSIINLAGLKEAVESFTGKSLNQEESLKFAEEIAQNAVAAVHKMGRKHGKRLFPAILHSPEASDRLAQLDIEKYGVAKVKFSGTRETPFYSTTRRLQLQTGNFAYVPAEALDLEKKLRSLNAGGNLTIIDMNGLENKPEELLKLTTQLMQNQPVEFLTYNRKITYCQNCSKSWFGDLHKCPSCGSIGTLVTFDRFNST